jgi:acidic type I keratin
MSSIQSEKEIMQDLDDPLASHLDRAQSLETDNRRLESKIWEHLEKIPRSKTRGITSKSSRS